MMELSAYGRFCRRTCMNAGHTSSSGSLHILTGNEKGKTFILNTMFGSSIGRDPSGNDIVLSDDSVSRSHARISYDGSRWNIESLAPKNSLKVNQREVVRATIGNGDTINVGTLVSFRFTCSTSTLAGAVWQPPPPVSFSTPISAPPSPPLQSGPMTVRAPLASTIIGSPALAISTNTSPGQQVYQLTKQVINIGRDPSNEIAIPAPVVSAFHAQIVRNGNQLVLIHPHPQAKGQKTLN